MATAGSPDTLTFLGTGGARIMVAHQLLASGGMWLNLGGTQLLVDPGPGCIVQATKRKLDPEKLAAVILSHRHLDHSGDVNVMVEAMTGGGLKHHGFFYAPADALDREPVLFSYLRPSLEGVVTLEAGKSYKIDDFTMSTPLRHLHPVETYGLVFRTKDYSLAYIADTAYTDALVDAYKGNDLVIINVVLMVPRPGVQHLTIADAGKVIAGIKPKLAVLNHFGMNVWCAHPWELAEELTKSTGVHVVAARDGMVIDLKALTEGT